MVVLSKMANRLGAGFRPTALRHVRSSNLLGAQVRYYSANTALSTSPIFVSLKDQIYDLAMSKADLIKEVRTSTAVVDTVTPSQIFGGMRGIPGMVTETSDLDAATGITYRGYSLKEANELLPKAPGGEAGLPEAAFWLLLTGKIPTAEEVSALQAELAKRAPLPDHVVKTMDSVPASTHPMTQLSIGILAAQAESKYAAAYASGQLKKTQYWEYALDDSLTLIAQIPLIAAKIYRKSFHGDTPGPAFDPSLDWAGNYANMLGCAAGPDADKFLDVTRLYLMLHADHEGGNVSAHTTHVVASALGDPFLAWGAGNCGLAGPLHGLANQECLKWLQETQSAL